MSYTDVVNQAKDCTYGVVSELKNILSSSREGVAGVAGVADDDGGDDSDDTIAVPRKKLNELLAAAKLGNKNVSKVHRYTQFELNRSNFEKAILKKAAVEDTVDREACFTHTLGVIQELEGMSNVVNQGAKIAAQINHMLGGLTSPPSLHFFDAALAAYVQDHDLINYAKSPSGPAFEEFLYQFTGAYLDKTIAPGSLASSVLFVPRYDPEPEVRPDPMEFVIKDTRSKESINASFVDFMNFAAMRTLEETGHSGEIGSDKAGFLSQLVAASAALQAAGPAGPAGPAEAAGPAGPEEMNCT